MLIHICTWSILLWDGARTPGLWEQQCALGWNGSEEAFYTAAAGGAPACSGPQVLPSTQGLPCSASPARDVTGLGTAILAPGMLEPESHQSIEVFTQQCSMELLLQECAGVGHGQDAEKSGASRS